MTYKEIQSNLLQGLPIDKKHIEAFYESDEWREERERVLFRWSGKCEHCGGETDSPHVHHKYGLAYRIYEVLCPNCHADYHGMPHLRENKKKRKIHTRCCYCDQKIILKLDDCGKWTPYSGGKPHRCIRKMNSRCRKRR